MDAHYNIEIEENENSLYSSKSNDKASRNEEGIKRTTLVIITINAIFLIYFALATYHYLNVINVLPSIWMLQWFLYFRNRNLTQTKSNETHQNERCTADYGIQWCEGYGMLLILTFLMYLGLFYHNCSKLRCCRSLENFCWKPMTNFTSKLVSSANRKFILVFLSVVIIAGSCYLLYDSRSSTDRLRSILGIFILYGIGFIFSKHISHIKWRPVVCGMIFQFFLGIFCIRIKFGRNVFECIGKKVDEFLSYSKIGSQFVYGNFLIKQEVVFAFALLPVIFFFSFIISILYHWGIMQCFLLTLGRILQFVLGTTVCESVAAAGNIFLGMVESPLLIKPYIAYLTASEMHAVMASGFATMSGTVMAAYIAFGAEPAHLITSSVMAAPASLAFSKLFYPETETSKTLTENIEIEQTETNSCVLEAASNGASSAINLVLGIIANLVAFVSFMALLNGIVNWLGCLIGFDDLSFEWIFGKLFVPLAYIIGIPWNDCENVAKIIATKTIVNEFVAYERLGKMKIDKLISLRSSAITTFAICGFANPCSLGILIGGLGALVPEKRGLVASLSFRAFVTGSFVCFINASIAGLLMTDEIFKDVGS